MTKHTPGPCTANKQGVITSQHGWVGEVRPEYGPIFAAAPELLRACWRFVVLANGCRPLFLSSPHIGDIFGEALEFAEAVIAKAEGTP